MSLAIVAGAIAALLAACIVVPILNARQPRWYMAMGYFGIRVLTPPLVWLTKMLERINRCNPGNMR